MSPESNALRADRNSALPERSGRRRQGGVREGSGKQKGIPDVRDAPMYRRTSSPTNEVLRVLRKEVIQPQVPLRLPCYDLVPIVELTFGACLSCELAQRLRALPTFVA